MNPCVSQSLILGTLMENIVRFPFMKMSSKKRMILQFYLGKWGQQREFSAEGSTEHLFHMLQATKDLQSLFT